MDPKQDRRLSLLLDRQQAGELSDTERSELLALMQVYQEGLLRKAQALHEAGSTARATEAVGTVSPSFMSAAVRAGVRAVTARDMERHTRQRYQQEGRGS